MSNTAQKLAEKLLEFQALAKEVDDLCRTFLREECPNGGMPPDGILRDIWYFEGSDHMNFLSGEVADGDVSLAGIAKDVLKYANQKAVA